MQISIGSEDYVDVPGGADSREAAVCGYASRTENDIAIRAVNTIGAGRRNIIFDMRTRGECEYFITTVHILNFMNDKKHAIRLRSGICGLPCAVSVLC